MRLAAIAAPAPQLRARRLALSPACRWSAALLSQCDCPRLCLCVAALNHYQRHGAGQSCCTIVGCGALRSPLPLHPASKAPDPRAPRRNALARFSGGVSNNSTSGWSPAFSANRRFAPALLPTTPPQEENPESPTPAWGRRLGRWRDVMSVEVVNLIGCPLPAR